MRRGSAAFLAGVPRHVPRGVRTDAGTLAALRRYGAEMRSLLALNLRLREGARAAAVPGQGMHYAESRPYSPGDDVRRIDWRVTARTGRAHTKLFELERGRDIFCIVDQRPAMHFGTRAAFKSVVAAQIAVLAGWAAADGGERFGALIVGAQAAGIATGAAQGSAAALCVALGAESGDAEAGDAGSAVLDACAARAVADASIGTQFLVVTDFADSAQSVARAVQALRARGDVFLLWVHDAMEIRLPPPARYALTDGHEYLLLDTRLAAVRAAQARAIAAKRARLARFAAQPGVRVRAVCTGEELFAALARPFTAQDPQALQ